MTVKLFGTLSLDIPGYNPAVGIEVDLPCGARIADLLARFNLKDQEEIIVIRDQTIAHAGDTLTPGSRINIFQMIAGG